MRARLAAYTLHSRVDGAEHTKPAQRGFLAKFERQVDPERQLSEEERQRRAHAALKAHMTRLALRSAKARRRGGDAA